MKIESFLLICFLITCISKYSNPKCWSCLFSYLMQQLFDSDIFWKGCVSYCVSPKKHQETLKGHRLNVYPQYTYGSTGTHLYKWFLWYIVFLMSQSLSLSGCVPDKMSNRGTRGQEGAIVEHPSLELLWVKNIQPRKPLYLCRLHPRWN